MELISLCLTAIALKAGDQVQVKDEPRDDSMSIEGTPNATPGPSEAKSGTFDSKESTFAGFDLDEKDAKDLKDLEEEEKKEINLSEAFDFKVSRTVSSFHHFLT